MSPRRRRQIALLLAIFSLLLAFGAVEVVFRLRPTPLTYVSMRQLPQHLCMRPDPVLQYRHREGFRGTLVNAEYRTRIEINSRGLREREISLDRVTGKPRILVLGDSFAFGMGVEAEEALPRQLENRIPGTEVLNAGCSGWSTRQEYDFLRTDGMAFRPDLVLLVFCENDPVENSFQYRFQNGRLLSSEEPAGGLAAADRWWASHSAAYVILRHVVRKLSGRVPTGTTEQDWAEEDRLLSKISAECRNAGARLVVLSVPGRGPDGVPKSQHWDRDLRETCDRQGVPLIDPLSEFLLSPPNRPIGFRLDDHWTQWGHEAAAAAAASAISPMLETRGLWKGSHHAD